MKEKTYTISQIREALRREFCPYCKMSHQNCRGKNCEVYFVINTLDAILKESEYRDRGKVIT